MQRQGNPPRETRCSPLTPRGDRRDIVLGNFANLHRVVALELIRRVERAEIAPAH